MLTEPNICDGYHENGVDAAHLQTASEEEKRHQAEQEELEVYGQEVGVTGALQ